MEKDVKYKRYGLIAGISIIIIDFFYLIFNKHQLSVPFTVITILAIAIALFMFYLSHTYNNLIKMSRRYAQTYEENRNEYFELLQIYRKKVDEINYRKHNHKRIVKTLNKRNLKAYSQDRFQFDLSLPKSKWNKKTLDFDLPTFHDLLHKRAYKNKIYTKAEKYISEIQNSKAILNIAWKNAENIEETYNTEEQLLKDSMELMNKNDDTDVNLAEVAKYTNEREKSIFKELKDKRKRMFKDIKKIHRIGGL